MVCPFFLTEMPGWLRLLILVLIIWEAIWKLIAMWRAARSKQVGWFICLAFVNTAGILPIIYILTHGKKTITELS